MHSNTVKYRLRKIERQTGLSLERLQDLMELQVALGLHDLDPARFQAEAHVAQPDDRRGGKPASRQV